MSEIVSNALIFTKDERVEETAKFIGMIDKFFDTLNVTNLVTGKIKRKVFQSPYMKSSKGKDFRLKVHTYFIQQVISFTTFIYAYSPIWI